MITCVLEAKGKIVGRRKNFDCISLFVSMNKLPIQRFFKSYYLIVKNHLLQMNFKIGSVLNITFLKLLDSYFFCAIVERCP